METKCQWGKKFRDYLEKTEFHWNWCKTYMQVRTITVPRIEEHGTHLDDRATWPLDPARPEGIASFPACWWAPVASATRALVNTTNVQHKTQQRASQHAMTWGGTYPAATVCRRGRRVPASWWRCPRTGPRWTSPPRSLATPRGRRRSTGNRRCCPALTVACARPWCSTCWATGSSTADRRCIACAAFSFRPPGARSGRGSRLHTESNITTVLFNKEFMGIKY